MKVESILHLLVAVAPLVSITHGLAPLGDSQILPRQLPAPKREPEVTTTVYVYFFYSHTDTFNTDFFYHGRYARANLASDYL
jgi:hypothetical protein